MSVYARFDRRGRFLSTCEVCSVSASGAFALELSLGCSPVRPGFPCIWVPAIRLPAIFGSVPEDKSERRVGWKVSCRFVGQKWSAGDDPSVSQNCGSVLE